MHISVPLTVTDVLWQGKLEPEQQYRAPGEVRAVIGWPVYWADGQLLGEKWQPPAGDRRHHLAQLAFSIDSDNDVTISGAEFGLILEEPRSMVIDAYPQEVLEEQVRPVKLGLEPKLKFTDAAELGVNADVTIDFPRSVPVITFSGLQTAKCQWKYQAQPRHPLKGSRQMLAIIAIPGHAQVVSARLRLDVYREDRFLGLLKYGMSKAAQDTARWVLGD